MNKSKIILAATGGVIGIAALVMAFFAWSAYSAKTAALEGDEEEGTEGLETVQETAQKLSRDKVYPCAASVKAVQSNETLLVEWKDEAFKLASRGDRPVKPTTPAQFKADMVGEAQRLLALPGLVQGRIAKPDFAFGPFKEYIAEGKMPAEAKLAELQRQWDDIVLIVETLSKCGAAELVDVQFKAKAETETSEKDVRKKKNAKNAKAVSQEKEPSVQGYVVTFTTRPLGFVKSLNALETCERFVVVEGFAFHRERDVLNEALGGGDKKESQQQATGRRRRRGAAAVVKAEADEDKPKGGIITDPLLDAPFKVELTLSTYDFRTLEETAKEEDKK